jgi:hypothetical protein
MTYYNKCLVPSTVTLEPYHVGMEAVHDFIVILSMNEQHGARFVQRFLSGGYFQNLVDAGCRFESSSSNPVCVVHKILDKHRFAIETLITLPQKEMLVETLHGILLAHRRAWGRNEPLSEAKCSELLFWITH